jgi:hypothetical protein
LLLAATAGIDAQQPAKNDLLGSTLAEAEIRKLVDQVGVEQFRLREDATKRLSELAAVPPALRAAMKSDNPEASRRAILVVSRISKRGCTSAFPGSRFRASDSVEEMSSCYALAANSVGWRRK